MYSRFRMLTRPTPSVDSLLVLNIRRAEGIRLAVAGITASIFAFLLIIVIIVPIATALPGEPHEIPPASWRVSNKSPETVRGELVEP